MRKALLVGDGVVATGFSKMNHAYVEGLIRAGWQVTMLALNYNGDPHRYYYDIFPCYGLKGGDPFGVRRLKELAERIRPDVICVTNDPWNIPEYRMRAGNSPVVASVAVDGKNCRGGDLNGLSHVVFWTEFGEREAKLGGFMGSSSVIPLGVDAKLFRPMPQREARQELRLPKQMDGAFIVGAVGRNQPRKRLDLTMIYFAEWIKTRKIHNAYLFLHSAPTGDQAFDLKQLGQYLGISNRIIYSNPDIGMGVTEESLRRVYCSLDALLSTTQGEGWGLCQMEAMSCGVPCIVPDWSALGEWPGDNVIKVPCTTVACTVNGINAVGGIMDAEECMTALNRLHSDENYRLDLGERAAAHVRQDRFDWTNVGAQYAEAVDLALQPRELSAEKVS